MDKKMQMKIALICGMLGCLCFGMGDWLMLFGNPAYAGEVFWLTEGAASIPQWRYNLAMALAFPGIFLYGAALFSLRRYIRRNKERKIYHYLNAFGMTPWLALHLFYIMILTLFAWLYRNGQVSASHMIAEGLYGELSWVVILCEIVMIPVFIYWFYLQIAGKTVFPRWMAFTNVIVVFIFLKLFTLILPTSAFKIAFSNGLMSESMFIWMLIMFLYETRRR